MKMWLLLLVWLEESTRSTIAERRKVTRKIVKRKKMFRVVQQSCVFATDVIPEMNKLILNK